jgi:hypothetical protein
MKYVEIREDDISYFTEPRFLEKLYSPLFEENLPVNFSVVPNVCAAIQTSRDNIYRTLEHLDYDPLIPPEHRGSPQTFLLSENKRICDFLESLSNCQILQHGFTHESIDNLPEFMIANELEMERRAKSGKKMLTEMFGSVSFFVPPWDIVSQQAIGILRQHYKGLCLANISLFDFGKKSLFLHLHKKFLRRNYISFRNFFAVEHKGYCLSRFVSPESNVSKVLEALKTEKIVVLVNHHWEFFFDWSKLDSSFYKAWQTILNNIMGRSDLKIVTFEKLYDLFGV